MHMMVHLKGNGRSYCALIEWHFSLLHLATLLVFLGNRQRFHPVGSRSGQSLYSTR
ncbi:hypothetical protein GCK32_010193 [Trichostrongylus colubriformis]|uniref:Uncharacterized protein n=1 Tax=Trichostrongylus colubriformis TaxID=6319 RepID=A0AAN8IM94_TRICO